MEAEILFKQRLGVMEPTTSKTRRATASVMSGLFAISLNTIALKAADIISLSTAHGGLLRLIAPWLAVPLRVSGIASTWHAIGGPPPSDGSFQTGFHLGVGIVMALVYGLILEPMLRGPAFVKGLQYAVVVWILNAAVILPATGEGFAGARNLSLFGMTWFAAAHTAFFVVLGLLFEFLMTPSVQHPTAAR